MQAAKTAILRKLGVWIDARRGEGVLSGSSVMGAGTLLSIAPEKISRAFMYESLMKAIEKTLLTQCKSTSGETVGVFSLARRIFQFTLDEFKLGDCAALVSALNFYVKQNTDFTVDLATSKIDTAIIRMDFECVNHVLLHFSVVSCSNNNTICFCYDPWLALSDVSEDQEMAKTLQNAVVPEIDSFGQHNLAVNYIKHITQKLQQAAVNDGTLQGRTVLKRACVLKKIEPIDFSSGDPMTEVGLTPKERAVFLTHFCELLRTDISAITARRNALFCDVRMSLILAFMEKDFKHMLAHYSPTPMFESIARALPSPWITSGLAIMLMNAFVYFEDPEQTAVCSMWLRGLVGAAGALTAGRVLQAPLSTVFAPLAGAIGTLAAPLLVSTISQALGMGH